MNTNSSKSITTATLATAKAPTGTTAAGSSAAMTPADEMTGGADIATDDHVPTAQDDGLVRDSDQQVATPANWDRCNEAHCDLNRLGKAMDSAAIVAGRELAAAEQELGDGFDAFIRTRTPWNIAEARTLIAFAAQAGLTPEGLTAAVAVSMARLLEAVTMLGQLYVAEVEQGNAP